MRPIKIHPYHRIGMITLYFVGLIPATKNKYPITTENVTVTANQYSIIGYRCSGTSLTPRHFKRATAYSQEVKMPTTAIRFTNPTNINKKRRSLYLILIIKPFVSQTCRITPYDITLQREDFQGKTQENFQCRKAWLTPYVVGRYKKSDGLIC